jgi:hypothetical protein
MLTSTTPKAENGSNNCFAPAPLTMPPSLNVFFELLEKWMCGHEQALAFLHDLFFIAAIWDDLIDRDTMVPESDIYRVFEVALSLPSNPFYVQHIGALSVLLHNSVRNWKAANTLERDAAIHENGLMNAFVIRSSYIDLIGYCAMLIKGNAWAEQVTCEARLFNSREGFAHYLKSLEREKELRDGRLRVK